MTAAEPRKADPQPAPAPAPAPAPPRLYELFVSEKQVRIFWKLKDEGVTLSAKGIAWRTEGNERFRAWNEISGVNLSTGYIHKQGTSYACTITFRDGRVLIVRSVSAWGHKDEEREPVYREFVETVHARLARPEFSDVRFFSGSAATNSIGHKIALAIGTLFFVGLPLVLFFIGPPLEVLFILAAGAAFIWPLWRMKQTNELREYSARDLPYDLLP
jgi:hypothetical protein